jgi:hypothetical protein
MKIFGLIASLLFTVNAIGQKSYYFSDPLPSMENKIENVDKIWFGNYGSKSVSRSYEISEEGIFVLSTSISTMSREYIRESSKYEIRNKYIFGVIENDSIPCVLDGDNYYFGIRNRELLVGLSSKNILTKINSYEYIINRFEDGFYTPEIMSFKGGRLSFQQFNYDIETTVFDNILDQREIKSEQLYLVVLTPTLPEYEALLLHNIFGLPVQFKKKRS